MINFSKFFLKNFKRNNSLINTTFKNYLFTSGNKTFKSKDRLDLKEEFQEMLKETTISEEELKVKKQQEQIKQKESIDQANKDFEKKNQNLKKQWEHKRSNAEEEDESELEINHFKKKIKSAFFFNKSTNQGTEGKEENKGDQEKKESGNKEEKTEPGRISKIISGFANVWRQTFPGEENVELLLERRKQEALILKSKIKEPTEEEIAAIEAAIPEWKRGAVMLVADSGPQEKMSIFETAKRNLTNHVKNLKVYQETQKSLQDSELSLLIDDLKQSYTNVRENLKESQNSFLVVTRTIADRVSFKSPSSLAIKVMRKYDPSFELSTFEKEVDAIFKQLMTAFIRDDLDTVKLVAAESALAILTNEIKSRRERVRKSFIIFYF